MGLELDSMALPNYSLYIYISYYIYLDLYVATKRFLLPYPSFLRHLDGHYGEHLKPHFLKFQGCSAMFVEEHAVLNSKMIFDILEIHQIVFPYLDRTL